MNSSPTALFDSYEQDFRQFIGTIQEKLEGEGSDDRDGEQPYYLCSTKSIEQGFSLLEQRKTVLRRVEMELDEADEMVQSNPPTLSVAPHIYIM